MQCVHVQLELLDAHHYPAGPVAVEEGADKGDVVCSRDRVAGSSNLCQDQAKNKDLSSRIHVKGSVTK